MKRAALALCAFVFVGCVAPAGDGPTQRLPRSCTVTHVELAAHVDCEFD